MTDLTALADAPGVAPNEADFRKARLTPVPESQTIRP